VPPPVELPVQPLTGSFRGLHAHHA
jgi:hypothetical protein